MLKVFSLWCNSSAGHARFASCNCFIFFTWNKKDFVLIWTKFGSPKLLHPIKHVVSYC